jgi:hypothetical protein
MPFAWLPVLYPPSIFLKVRLRGRGGRLPDLNHLDPAAPSGRPAWPTQPVALGAMIALGKMLTEADSAAVEALGPVPPVMITAASISRP